jgi:hypothetical protein
MEKSSVLVKNSRYVSGGTSEVNARAIEWWERTVLTPDASDIIYVVERRWEGRIDLIANALLGDSRLWWLIAQYNAVLDPVNEIREGRVLRVPLKDRAQAFLNGRIGGVDSLREVPTNNITPIV